MTTAENSTTEPTAEAVVADASSPVTERVLDTSATDAAAHVTTDTAEHANETEAEASAAEPEGESAVASTADAVTDAQTEPAATEEPAERPAPVTDEVLLASVDIARAALLDVTPAETIGEPVGHVAEDDHVLSLFFDSKLRGYPGWHWTVTLARTDDGPVTVLETEMMPGDNALLAPEWVPWSERLADYQAGQESEARALAEAAAVLDDDEDDDDEEEFSILHAGDVDGVDVDEVDESDDDESDDDESDDDESDDDDAGSDDDDDESEDDNGDSTDEDGIDRSY